MLNKSKSNIYTYKCDNFLKTLTESTFVVFCYVYETQVKYVNESEVCQCNVKDDNESEVCQCKVC